MKNDAELVREYQDRLRDQAQYCSLELLEPKDFGPQRRLPQRIEEANLLYLGFSRNAWHSTWINRYYPGTVSFFERPLKEQAERFRTQGSQFRISSRPALLMRFALSSPIAIVSINDRGASSYSQLLAEVKKGSLAPFWQAAAWREENWLLVFRVSGWRPDLLPKNPFHYRASTQGSGKLLRWTKDEANHEGSGFVHFRERFQEILRHGHRTTQPY